MHLRRILPFLLVFAALAAACGDDDAADGPDTETTGDDAFPVEIDHQFGTTVIPERPERVVAAGFNDADYALAFGVTPVAVRDFIGAYEEESRPWAQDALDGEDPPKISDAEGILNFEEIAAAKPDLILAYSYLTEDEYDTLAAIAPTLTEKTPGSLWPDHTRAVGAALGMPERAEELVDEVEGAFSAAVESHPEFEGPVAAIQFGVVDDGYYLLEPQDPRVGLFTSLGLAIPDQGGEISAEEATLLDQDVVIVVGDPEPFESDDLFQNLDAVQDGRVVYLGGFETDFAGALGFDSPLSLPFAVDVLTPLLAAAIDASAADG